MLKQLSPSGSSVNSAKYLARRLGSRYIIIHHYSPLLRGIVLKVLINVGKLNDLPGGKGWGRGGVLDQWPVGIGDPLTLTLFRTKNSPNTYPV